jgi:hypothetical protein
MDAYATGYVTWIGGRFAGTRRTQMSNHERETVVKEKSGGGPLAAVIVVIVLVVFGYWAVNTFIATDSGDGGVDVTIEVPESGDGS